MWLIKSSVASLLTADVLVLEVPESSRDSEWSIYPGNESVTRLKSNCDQIKLNSFSSLQILYKFLLTRSLNLVTLPLYHDWSTGVLNPFSFRGVRRFMVLRFQRGATWKRLAKTIFKPWITKRLMFNEGSWITNVWCLTFGAQNSPRIATVGENDVLLRDQCGDGGRT